MTDDDALLNALERLATSSVRLTAAALAESPMGHDLTLLQWRLLVVLADGQPQRVGDLAERLGVSMPSASRLLRRLERRELVSTARDEADRRSTLVRLLPAGRRAHRSVVAARRRRMERALQQHGATGRAEVATARALAEALEDPLPA